MLPAILFGAMGLLGLATAAAALRSGTASVGWIEFRRDDRPGEFRAALLFLVATAGAFFLMAALV